MIQVLHRLLLCDKSGVVCVSFAPPVYYFIAKKVRLGVIHKCVDKILASFDPFPPPLPYNVETFYLTKPHPFIK